MLLVKMVGVGFGEWLCDEGDGKTKSEVGRVSEVRGEGDKK